MSERIVARTAAAAIGLLLVLAGSARADSRRDGRTDTIDPTGRPAAALRGTTTSIAVAATRQAGEGLLPAEPLPPHLADAIGTAVGEFMSQANVPGLSLAVAEGGELRWEAGYGLADLENEVAASSETVYRLASVSKPITAVAALRLAQKRSLDLDAPVWSYCAAYPPKPQTITARQILCHQGGVRHYREGELPPFKHFETIAEGLALFRADPLVFEPGTSVLYSTYGYTLLGCVIEGAAGRSFQEVLREEVFGPAGMRHTQMDDIRAVIPHRAGGYVVSSSGELRNSAPVDTSYKVPGGGLCGTAPDVARFGGALVSGKLLSRAALQQMLTPQRTKAGRVTGFGLGMALTVHGGRREAWHVGGQERVSTLLYTRPESGLSVAILSNLEGLGTPLLDLARRIGDLVMADQAIRSSE